MFWVSLTPTTGRVATNTSSFSLCVSAWSLQPCPALVILWAVAHPDSLCPGIHQARMREWATVPSSAVFLTQRSILNLLLKLVSFSDWPPGKPGSLVYTKRSDLTESWNIIVHLKQRGFVCWRIVTRKYLAYFIIEWINCPLLRNNKLFWRNYLLK